MEKCATRLRSLRFQDIGNNAKDLPGSTSVYLQRFTARTSFKEENNLAFWKTLIGSCDEAHLPEANSFFRSHFHVSMLDEEIVWHAPTNTDFAGNSVAGYCDRPYIDEKRYPTTARGHTVYHCCQFVLTNSSWDWSSS